MRDSIFKKGESLKDKVIFQEEGHEKAYFTFDTENAPTITLSLTPKGTYFDTCTCSHCSIHSGIRPETLCSYKIALIKRLPK